MGVATVDKGVKSLLQTYSTTSKIARLGSLTLCKFRSGKEQSRRRIELTTSIPFWEWLPTQISSKNRLHLIVDNAPLFALATGLWKAIDDGSVELDVPIKAKVSPDGEKVSYDYSRHQFVFGDRCCIISLLLPPQHRVKLLEYQNYFNTPLASSEGGFDRCDEIVDGVLSLRDSLDHIGYGEWKPTTSGLSMGSFRSSLGDKPLYRHETPEARKIERSSYYGGQTLVLGRGRIDEAVYYTDVTSMFPCVMQDGRYPTKLVDCWLNVNCTADKLAADPQSCIVRCRINSDSEIFPVRLEGKTLAACGEFDTFLCGPELEYALELDAVERVYDVCEYKTEPIFRDYISRVFELRKKYHAEGNHRNERAIKGLLNSLYGKFGQMSSDLQYRPDVFPPCQWGMWRDFDHSEGGYTDYKVCNGSAFRITPRQELGGSIPAIAAFVTSYAREYMRRLRHLAGERNVFYQGVDALLVNAQGMENLSDLMQAGELELGKLKTSHVGNFAIIYNANHYRIAQKLVQSGFAPEDTRTSDTSFLATRKTSLATAPFLGPDQIYREVTQIVFSEDDVAESAKRPFRFSPKMELHQ